MKPIVIYTDGASKGNPGPGGWGAIIISDDEVIELGGKAIETTNNKMELSAPIAALKYLKNRNEKIIIYTDSKYVINGITSWIFGWKKNGWKTGLKEDVLNVDLWKKLDMLVQNKDIEWKYVPGHSGVEGNERADEIASSFAQNKKPKLFVGEKQRYPLRILTPKHTDEIKKTDPYYLVLANGKITRFFSWAECKKVVEGRSGIKFKKVKNKNEEESIKKSWGL